MTRGWTAESRRGLYWMAVVLAVVALIGGATVAWVSYSATAGPDGAVKGYLAALARDDAAAALGFGDLPPGPHTLLTSTVLAEQQRIAPLRGVQIAGVAHSGDTATVTVNYRLDFAGGAQQVNDVFPVVRRNGSWRLKATAATTQLNLHQAFDRATIAGNSLPTGTVLLFPGAIPVRFDTPYLGLDAATSNIRMADGPTADLSVVVTDAGHQAADTAMAAALTTCLAKAGAADPRCPLPSLRAVPGTLQAAVPGDLRDALARHMTVIVAGDARGVLQVAGQLTLTGRYSALNFDDLPVAQTGSLTLPLLATAFAVVPLRIDWQQESS